MTRTLFVRWNLLEKLKTRTSLIQFPWRSLLITFSLLLLSGCLGTENSGVTDGASRGNGGGSTPMFRGAETANPESIDTIKVEWIAPTFEQNIGSLNIYEVLSNNTLNLIAVLGSGEAAFYHTGLQPGTPHVYVVRGLNNETGQEDENDRRVQATTLSSDGNPLTINPTSLAMAYGQTYFLKASGGEPPYKFSIVSGPGAILDDETGEFIALFSSGMAVVKVSDSVGSLSYSGISVTEGFQLHPESMELIEHRHLPIATAGATEPVTYTIIGGDDIAQLSEDGVLESLGGLGLVTIRVQDATGLSRDSLIKIVSEMTPQSNNILSLSIYNTCHAQRGGNRIKCWGRASGGGAPTSLGSNIGDQPGEMGDNLTLTDLGNNATIEEIKGGANMTCALFNNDRLKCWGQASFGRLLNASWSGNYGDESEEMGNTLPFLELGTNTTVKQFDVGFYHSCVVTNNDDLKCWGHGFYGQLGNEWRATRTLHYLGASVNDLGDNLPIALLGNQKVKKVATGWLHTCAIMFDDSLRCWGYNTHGQLGLGHTNFIGDDGGEMSASMTTVGIGSVKDVSAGAYNTCVITMADEVKCWGRNAFGQLGQENNIPIGDNELVTTALPLPMDFGNNLVPKSIEVGNDSVCIIFEGSPQTSKCVGHSTRISSITGHKGDQPDEMGDALPFLEFGTYNGSPESILKISYDELSDFGCALLGSQRVKCWGHNAAGQVGAGNTSTWGDSAVEKNDGLPYVDLGTGRTAIDIAVGHRHACAVLDNNTVRCWGQEVDGSLGHGDSILGDSSSELSSLENLQLGNSLLISKIESADSAHCVLFTNGLMKCFGSNWAGQLGQGNTAIVGDNPGEISPTLPNSILSDTRIIRDITMGYLHGCAIFANQQLKCWGYGFLGELGNEKIGNIADNPGEVGTDTAFPFIDLGSTDTVLQVDTGMHSTCVLTTDNEVKCWGRNIFGNLGQGNTDPRGQNVGDMGSALPSVDLGATPEETVIQLNSGAHHNCVVFNTGKVKCWGYNSSGRLGIGSDDNRGDEPNEMGINLPYVDLGSDFFAIKVVAGINSTCALSREQKVKCWGFGGDGELGSASVATRGTSPEHMGDNLEYLDFGAFRHVVDIFGDARAAYKCVTLDNNEKKCWGNNSFSQLGLGDKEARGDNPGEMGDSLPAIIPEI